MKSYQENILLRTCDCDMNGQWRPSALLTAMQETSGAHCALLGCGRDDLLKRGIVWILARSEVQMDRYPNIGETITVQTFHKPVRLRFFPRYYIFKDSAGDVIGKAGTLWLLMDIHTRQTIPAGDIAALLPDNSDLAAPMALPATVGQLQGEETVSVYHPVYTDLDVNGHVNNTRYADWLCDALGIDLLRQKRIAVFSVDYRREVMPGDEIRMTLHRDDNGFSLFGARGDTPAFDIGGAFAADPAPGNDVRG